MTKEGEIYSLHLEWSMLPLEYQQWVKEITFQTLIEVFLIHAQYILRGSTV
mgnify:FL=1